MPMMAYMKKSSPSSKPRAEIAGIASSSVFKMIYIAGTRLTILKILPIRRVLAIIPSMLTSNGREKDMMMFTTQVSNTTAKSKRFQFSLK
jgi:hypothetical protein